MSVPLKAGTQPMPQLTMPHFKPMMIPEESAGMFRRATPTTLTSQEMCLSPRTLSPLRRLHDDKRKLSIVMSFPKKGGMSQHTCEACGQPLLSRKTP